MKKKHFIGLVVVLSLTIASIFLLTNNKRSSITHKFNILDTSIVTKIFLADKNNNMLELSRTDTRGWRINNEMMPIKENVDLLLETLNNTQIKYPVSKSARNSTIARLATNHVKVEVYGKKPLFTILGKGVFTKERQLLVFYVGGPTADNQGTIMKLEKDDDIFITYLPGLRGYLTERYSPQIADWKSHQVFSYLIGDIKKVRVDFPQDILQSYEIINNGNRTFSLTQLQNNRNLDYFDTIRVLESLAAFNSVNYEAMLDEMPKQKTDSLLSSIPLRVISIETFKGEQRQLKLYRRANVGNLLDFNGELFPYDVDRLYGFIDTNHTPVALQYFVIDNITRPLSYFVETNQVPIQE
ncbi:MAG: hypothetical protein JXR34_01045 [Bacteroidales bacterium]|nr:hypothetical protein [Bacteroidales bacterium]